MTNCDLTKGRLLACKNSAGGLFRIWYGNWEDWVFTQDADEKITDITDGEEVPGPITIYQWDLKGASSLVETPTVSSDNGSAYWEQVLTAVFKKLDALTRKELKMMTYGLTRALVQDNNGNVMVVGRRRGLDVSGGSNATGTALGDLSGYTVVQTGMEIEPAEFLDGATIEDPFAGLTTPPTIVVGV